MNTRLSLLLLALASPGLASAAPPAWTVDKATSSLRFASSMGGEAFSGVFRRWDADIRFDPADLAHSSVAVTIDVASADTANPDRDQALPTPAFFDAPAFPKATYVARSFTAAGPGHYLASGVLTLRGVAKPLTLPFTLVITGPSAKMSGAVAINRLAFGVGQNEWKATTTLPAAVQLTIALNARRAK
jgi:polyisoprenoid-binding protein YceI